MPDERPSDDLKRVWQSQPTGTSIMTVKLIQSKARELQVKTRTQMLGTLVGPAAAGLFWAFGAKQFPSLAGTLNPLFAFGLAWSLAGFYFATRGLWTAVMPGDAGLSSGLEFCRAEIERRRRLLRRLLVWSFGPLVFTLGTFIAALAMAAGDRLFPNGLPFLILVVAWVIGYFVMRMREQQGLQREIDELDDLERENSR